MKSPFFTDHCCELRERIADGSTLRQFTNFYCLPMLQYDAFRRAFNQFSPETLKAINDLVVQSAVDLGLQNGQMLRVDTTVVQTDVHHPTDNTLFWDVARVVTRLIGRLVAALQRGRIRESRGSDTTRAASDARDPMDDQKAAPGASGTYR